MGFQHMLDTFKEYIHIADRDDRVLGQESGIGYACVRFSAVKSDPSIRPWTFCISFIFRIHTRIDKKCHVLSQFVVGIFTTKCAFALSNKMNHIFSADVWAKMVTAFHIFHTTVAQVQIHRTSLKIFQALVSYGISKTYFKFHITAPFLLTYIHIDICKYRHIILLYVIIRGFSTTKSGGIKWQ